MRPSSEDEDRQKVYMIDALPLGLLNADGVFEREVARSLYRQSRSWLPRSRRYRRSTTTSPQRYASIFAQLAQDNQVDVPVDGNRFFNKHVAIVGSTGAGKSHAVARIVQTAVQARDEQNTG